MSHRNSGVSEYDDVIWVTISHDDGDISKM